MRQALPLPPRGKPAPDAARNEAGARTCCVRKTCCTCIRRN